MASLIKGKTVVLYEKIQTGTDAFNAPIYQENPVEVENVLICPVDSTDIVGESQLRGKYAEYELCIPKGDTHDWENRRVEFFGHSWETFGFVREWIEENVPLDWNRKVRVRRYG